MVIAIYQHSKISGLFPGGPQQVSESVDEVQKIIKDFTVAQGMATSSPLRTVEFTMTTSKYKGRECWYYTLSSPHMHKWLEREGFANLSQRWNGACMAIEGDIVTTKVACVFKEQVEAAIKTCGLTGEIKEGECTGHDGFYSACHRGDLGGTYYGRAGFRRWPSAEHISCIKVRNGWAASSYHWLLSFPLAEQVLLGNIDKDGGCGRNHCCSGHVRGTHVPGFRRNLMEVLLYLVQKLHKCVCVSQHYLRHYLVCTHNLLKYTSISELGNMVKKISDFLDDPSYLNSPPGVPVTI
uniref:Mab-21-like HhH/H2TH-like domain-containing protein n=1 Tax=Electrophorus electricus TaxID=8005 RepID=A0AAY5EFP8_ELEEL